MRFVDLEADLNDEDPVGGKIQQKLANIALKLWGISLSTDKLKALLTKHTKPENCAEMMNDEWCAEITAAKVNPEIYSQMNNFKRKTDLRVGNAQQDYSLLSTKINVSKKTLSQSVDAISLIGLAVRWIIPPTQRTNQTCLKARILFIMH